jgi:hypothetical protein
MQVGIEVYLWDPISKKKDATVMIYGLHDSKIGGQIIPIDYMWLMAICSNEPNLCHQLCSQKNVNWAIPKKITQFTLTPFSCAMNPLTTQDAKLLFVMIDVP